MENKIKPPALADRFLEWFCSPDKIEEIQGDLHEAFYIRLGQFSTRKAKLIFMVEVLKSFKASNIKRVNPFHSTSNLTAMYKNYFQIALRHIRRNPTHMAINVFGLGLALACCIVTYLLFEYNIKFDSVHGPKEDVFRIHADHKVENDIQEFASISVPLAPMIKQEISGVIEANRYNYDFVVASKGDLIFNEMVHYTDTNFFKIFDFDFVEGSPKSFTGNNSMVLTEKLSKKYFGDTSPLGQEIFLNYRDKEIKGFEIVGVVKDHPSNSSFQFNAIVPFENFLTHKSETESEWIMNYLTPSTFVKLADPANAKDVEKQLKKYVELNNKLNETRQVAGYHLVPFKDVGRTNYKVNDSRTNGAMSNEPIILFVAMSGGVLLIACFNFMNTSIALARKRFKEIGIRKVLGSVKQQIINQFMFENLAICFSALMIGLILAELILPEFNALWSSNFSIDYSNNLLLIGFLVALLLITAIFAGIYPSIYISSFQPSSILKGMEVQKGPNFLIKFLLTLQFGISIIGIVAGLVFYQNSVYQNSIDLGYNKEDVLFLYIPNAEKADYFRQKVLQHPKVKAIGGASQHIGFSGYGTQAKYAGKEAPTTIVGIGKNYLNTMGIKILEGRDFYYQHQTENDNAVIINEKLAEVLGLENPVGTTINVENQDREIIGVVNNFYHYSVYSPIIPMAFALRMDDVLSQLTVRAEKGQLEEVSAHVEKVWKELYPTRPYEGALQDSVMEGARRLNMNMVKIFLFLSVISTLLSITGLFSLVTLNINKRMKEIGIRKVLGASVFNIMRIINTDFIVIVMIASVIGCVAGYFLLDMLLDQFYSGGHIELKAPVFILSFMILLLLALITIARKVYAAATSNPVSTLRSE